MVRGLAVVLLCSALSADVASQVLNLELRESLTSCFCFAPQTQHVVRATRFMFAEWALNPL